MKQNKLWNVVTVLIWLVQLAVELTTAAIVWRLNMIPDKYMLVLLALLAVLAVLPALLLFVGKKGNGYGRKTGGAVLSLVVVLLCAFIATVAADIHDTIHSVANKPTNSEGVTMAIYVLQEDPAQNLTDAADYIFGYLENYEEARTEQVLASVTDKLGREVRTQGFASAQDLVEGLYQGRVGAVILNSGTISILADQEGYGDVSSRIRVLSQVVTLLPEDTAKDPEATVDVGPRDLTNTPFVLYLSGSDTRSSYLETAHSDVNILMVVNPNTKQILLVNTPRDYYVGNPAGNGKMDKLTHCGWWGPSCSMQALSELYGVDVIRYGRINFRGFETFIDAIGGITIYSDVAFRTTHGGVFIQQGENYLDGEAALAFARERYHLAGGDNDRGRNHMKVITAVINKMTSGTTIISSYTSILESLTNMLDTDLTADEMSSLVKMQLDDMATWDILSFAVTGTGGSDYTYSAPGQKLYVTYQDPESVARASQLMQRVLNGEKLTQEDVV